MKFLLLVVLASIQGVFAQANAGHYTQTETIRKHLEGIFGEKAKEIIFGQEHKKNVSVIGGRDHLMAACSSDINEERWKIAKHWWDNIAHTHPFSTWSCRQKNDPSLHMLGRLIRKKNVYTFKMEIHLDGHGPKGFFAHPNEFFFHKLTLQGNNQDVMYANVERAILRSTALTPAFITNHERRVTYFNETFGLGAVIPVVANGLFRQSAHRWIWPNERHYEPLPNRIEGALMKHTIRNSIEFGVATWLKEDSRYKPSNEPGVKKRLWAALKATYVVKTPTGSEFAFARFAAIGGTMAIVDNWHPWTEHGSHHNYIRQGVLKLSLDPVVQSLWTEFSADAMRLLKKAKP